MSPKDESTGGAEEQDGRRASGAPYESVLLKTVEKLRDQLLLFLLGYAVLIVVLAMAGSDIIVELRYLLYAIPVLGVLAYVGLTYLRMRQEEGEEEVPSTPPPPEEAAAVPSPSASDVLPSVDETALDAEQIQVLVDVRGQMSNLLTFAVRELLPYPYSTEKRNEEIRYFFNEKCEHLAARLGELGLLVSPHLIQAGENVYEMFNALWRMCEREEPRQVKEAYLVEVRDGVQWFTDIAKGDFNVALKAARDYKAKLARELRGEMRSLVAFSEREVMPYPHEDESQNRDAEWYFKERTERISAGLGAMTLFASRETLKRGQDVLRQFEALWRMAADGEPIEVRNEQRDRIARSMERFDLLLRRELGRVVG